VLRVSPGMKPQELSNVAWAYAMLGWEPGADARVALEVAVVRVGLGMNPQNSSNTIWSFATMGLMPSAEARAALEAAVVRVGPGMCAQDAANTLWSVATLGQMPGAEAWAALEAAVVRVGPCMNAQGAANTMWGVATLGQMPGTEVWAALEVAVVRVGSSMKAQDVATTLWSIVTLGLMPGTAARTALEAAVVRMGMGMKAQDVANTLWSCLTLAITRGIPLPACYPALWQAACGLSVDALKTVGLRNFFHAYLMHTELVRGNVPGDVTFPPWIMNEARGAWMRQAHDDVTMSRDHKEVASIIGELGVAHEVERLTNDGYFSVDVYMPGADVALEIDGPSHFTNISVDGDRYAPGDAPRNWRRTPRTELRDMFLARRHHLVVCVPYFEYDKLKGRMAQTTYIAEKLRGAGVHVPASAI
jgi:hypothetical protein